MSKTQLAHYICTIISVSEEELNYILSYFHPLKPVKNEILIPSGQVNQRMFFINKGCLRIFFIQPDGQEATRYLAFENKFATALSSFITKEPSLESIQALEHTEVLYISRTDFYHLLEHIPAWEKFYRSYLERAYVHNTQRLMSFVTMTAAERYKQLLEENPIIVQRLPNKVVASYLNLSQETLSRLKSKV
ncbi:Crp/Fnr family transcriptional regulator [Cytophagaceae bacterium DM2B3-1]|uniref:Crp/Fnr family transcriptional regulator n=1 Tax=Xanthocytophaga flava TaxID=3048013 RepID=A0ABT7CVG9_9BACT|nr:Crp/Fnr family transcriptional regulator [Xanthocytophaga flavus]MDJ1497710.1 Crp/Fnr family transcriptional regulator [Xanthocytophaga flavus]